MRPLVQARAQKEQGQRSYVNCVHAQDVRVSLCLTSADHVTRSEAMVLECPAWRDGAERVRV